MVLGVGRVRLWFIVEDYVVLAMSLHVSNGAYFGFRAVVRFQGLFLVLGRSAFAFQAQACRERVSLGCVRGLEGLVRVGVSRRVACQYSAKVVLKYRSYAIFLQVCTRATRFASLGKLSARYRAILGVGRQASIMYFCHGHCSRRSQ